MLPMNLLLTILITLTQTFFVHAGICNYRVENLTIGGPLILPMGCDPVIGTMMYTCYNATHVNISNFTSRPCVGNTTDSIVPASDVNAYCGDMLDCVATTKQWRTNNSCAKTEPFGYANDYAGSKCQEVAYHFKGVKGSFIRTCSFQSYYIQYDFMDNQCSNNMLTSEDRVQMNKCHAVYDMAPSNTSLKSEQVTCPNPQGYSVPTIPANPKLLELLFYSDERCTGQEYRSLKQYALSFANNRKCANHNDSKTGTLTSQMQSCDTQGYDWENYFDGYNCSETKLMFRQGTVRSTCEQGVRRICHQSFGPVFPQGGKPFVKIQNFLSSDCQLRTFGVSNVDEYTMGTCLGGGAFAAKYECNADGTTSVTRTLCGSVPLNVTYELNVCIPNPDPISVSVIPYVMVEATAGCGPPLVPTTPNNKGNSSAVGLGIGISLGVIILLGVGCIFYRRAKLKQEHETMALLTNETEK